MILDSSAVVAILTAEPEGERLREIAILEWPTRRISAPTLLETAIVLDGKRNQELSESLEDLIRILNIQVVSFDKTLASISRTAYSIYGRGSGQRANLNFGDTFSYAMAKHFNEPLLFIGDDFIHTDITPATLPEATK